VLSRLTLDWSPLGQVLAYRTLGLALEVATLGVLWWLLERLRTPDRTRAWLVYAWNPLILFDLVGAGHNDVAMLALLLVGIAISTGGAALAGIGMLALSALVKYASALVVLLAATAWSARGDSRSARVRRMTLGLGVALLLAIAFWAPWLTSRDAWLVLGDAAGGKLVLNSAPDVIALWIADHASVEPDLARLWVRWTTRLVFAAFFCGELWRVWRSRGDTVHLVKACTRAMLLVPLLVLTWVWSWYFSWSLVLAVLVGWDWRGTRLVVAYTIVALPIVYAHQYLNDQFPAGWILVMALVPLLVLVPIRRGGAARTFSKRGGGTMQ
jgi:alpha-1,6-mannosyltransferase